MGYIKIFKKRGPNDPLCLSSKNKCQFGVIELILTPKFLNVTMQPFSF